MGLSSIGAAGVHIGPATMEREADGFEVGALVDWGWVRHRALRIEGEVSFMQVTLSEFVVTENREFRGHVYDLSTSLSLVVHGGNSRSRLVPFLSAGVGVHALSSAFSEVSLDQRYNANPFGSHIGAGARIWIPGLERHGVFVEVRRAIAEHVNRTVVRFGGLIFYNDLIR
ncbi:MAG TPA: hypothetical protein VF178_17240 [Gemmatimonadaceae bacterium]